MNTLKIAPIAVAALAAVALTASPAGAQQSPAGCHTAYVDCVPANRDVDCVADKLPQIRLRAVGTDPYRLDRNNDGIGCEADESTSTAPTRPTPSTTKKATTPTTRPKAAGAVRATPRFTG
jgi:hypothetical protein